MMWKRTRLYLIVASVALNVAFVATWIAHATVSHADPEETGRQQTEHTIWCPLHRELGVSEQQWAQIEPRLREFQAAVGELRQQVDTLRTEVIDLMAAEELHVEAVLAKQEEILATKQRIQRRVVDHLVAERKVLTAEQQQQLFAMLRNRTGCPNPPLSGPRGIGLGRVFQNRDGGKR